MQQVKIEESIAPKTLENRIQKWMDVGFTLFAFVAADDPNIMGMSYVAVMVKDE